MVNRVDGGWVDIALASMLYSKCLTVWLYGCMAVWMYGCVDVWLYGMYGCVDVWRTHKDHRLSHLTDVEIDTVRAVSSPSMCQL